MTTDAMPRRSGSLRWEPFGSGLLVHDSARAEVHLLNATAALLWEVCDGVTSIDEVVDALAGRAQHPRDEIDRDVRASLEAMRGAGLLDRPELPDPVRLGPPEPVDEPLSSPLLRVVDERAVVRSNSRTLLERVQRVFGDLLDGEPGRGEEELAQIGIHDVGGGSVRLYGRGHDQTFGDLGDLDEALAALINRIVGTSTSPLAFHAGAVRSPDGLVVGLPGHSGSGKSTLVGALVAAGWDYLTDEALGVRPDTLMAVGYPKPLSLDDRSQQLVGVAPGPGPMIRSDRLRAGRPAVLGDAGTIALIVLPTHTPGASTRLDVVDPDAAVVELAGHAINLTPAGTPGLRTLVALAEQVRCLHLVHDDLDEAVAAIDRVVHAHRTT